MEIGHSPDRNRSKCAPASLPCSTGCPLCPLARAPPSASISLAREGIVFRPRRNERFVCWVRGRCRDAVGLTRPRRRGERNGESQAAACRGLDGWPIRG